MNKHFRLNLKQKESFKEILLNKVKNKDREAAL
jgi:hypothetical protein